MDAFDTSDNRNNRAIDQQILRAIKSVCYGSVEITIQNSKVVQIEVKEKLRFGKGLLVAKLLPDHWGKFQVSI